MERGQTQRRWSKQSERQGRRRGRGRGRGRGRSSDEAEAGATAPSDVGRLELSSLLREMRRLVDLDLIAEARSTVERIREVEQGIPGPGPHGLVAPSDCALMDQVVSESDRIERFLTDLRSNKNGWVLSQANRGVTIHYRNEEGSPIHSVKTHCVLEDVGSEGFVRICSLFLEFDLFPLWAPGNIIEDCAILATPSKYRKIVHIKISSLGKFSPLSPREAYIDGRGYILSAENAVLILSTSIDHSPFCDVPAPKRRGRVRIDVQDMFYLRMLPGRRVEFRQIAHDDLRLRLVPPALLNYLARGALPLGMIVGIRRILHKFETTEFQDRVLWHKRDLYKEIERRVVEELVLDASAEEDSDGDDGIRRHLNDWSSGTGHDRGYQWGITEEAGTELRVSSRRSPGINTSSAGLARVRPLSAFDHNPVVSKSNSISLFTAGSLCLFSVFVGQFGIRLSLYWADIPFHARVGITGAVLGLGMAVWSTQATTGSVWSGCDNEKNIVRIRRRDGSITVLAADDDDELGLIGTRRIRGKASDLSGNEKGPSEARMGAKRRSASRRMSVPVRKFFPKKKSKKADAS